MTNRKTYRPALALVILSGAAALAHQLIWVRLMVDILGAGAGNFARVVGAFFLGLSLGAWIASQRTPRNPLRSAAMAEGVVGVLALVILGVGARTSLAMAPAGFATFLEWALPFLLILPPALGMGLVLPWIIDAVCDEGGRASRLYAANTVGAVAGIVLIMGWALPGLGLQGAGLLAVGCNFLTAVGLWFLSPREAASESPARSAASNFPAHAALLGFASGFLILGQEVVLQHQFAQVSINSLFSGATVLALVLLTLALSAFVAPILLRRIGDSAMSWALGLAALGCAVQPFIFVISRGGLRYLSYELPALSYYGEVLRLGLMTIVPVMVFAGLVFPLLLVEVGGEGRATGRLLAWNGLGGLCGAELSNLLIAPFFGLWQAMMVFALGYLALFIMRKQGVAGVALAAVVVLALWFGSRLPQAALAQGEQLVALGVGREGVVGVIRKNADDWRILFNNTYTLGGSKAQFNQERQAHLPLLLHGDPKSVATLGVATGSTVAGAALHPTVTGIDAIELSPLAAGYARGHFSDFNRDVFNDPRVRLILGDARQVIERNPHAYDVVIGDLFLPWRTGEGRLYSREHFENVRRSLKEGGLFCQWLPLFQLTREQFEMILRTFQSVFPDTFLIRGDFYRDLPIVGLVGGRDLRSLDWLALEESCHRLAKTEKISDPLVVHPEGVGLLVMGTPPPLPPGPVNTLANAALEWNAGRNIVGLRQPWFVSDDFLDYVDANDVSDLPSKLREMAESGRAISRARKGDLAKLLPAPLLEDMRADWKHWPGRPKPFSDQ